MKDEGRGRAASSACFHPSSFILHPSWWSHESLENCLAEHPAAVAGLVADGRSMALGVALVVAVLVIHSVVHQSFNRGRGGYDLVVGARIAAWTWCSTPSITWGVAPAVVL